MPRKALITALTIALVAALVGGGTMAWFTAKADAPLNEFTAGTVMIMAGNEVVYPIGEPMDNVNPGDAFKKCVPVTNTGSKAIQLRMSSELILDIDWAYIQNNFEALCFSEYWDTFDELKDEVEAALLSGWVTNPAYAEEPARGPFDANDKLIIPIMAAPTPTGDWIMKYVNEETVFFLDGILQPGESTELCVVVLFDGPWMGNLWQGATFSMGGTFEAVQASNEAPQAVWGSSTWANYQAVVAIPDPKGQLAHDFGVDYAEYFYDEYGDFQYAYLCEMNGVPPECWTETAYGGDFKGDQAAWWYFFDTESSETQSIYVANEDESTGGTVTISVINNGNGKKHISIMFDNDWELQSVPEPVKIQGYEEDELPSSRPASGLFTTYKGELLEVEVDSYRYYVIHLDVQKCEKSPS